VPTYPEEPMPAPNASQRRRERKIAYDAFMATCPSRQLLDTITDKWVCLVLNALSRGSMRHGELATDHRWREPKNASRKPCARSSAMAF